VFEFGAYSPIAVFLCLFFFKFQENPLDAQLTIRHIELEAFIYGKRIITVKHSFSSFIIPVGSITSVGFSLPRAHSLQARGRKQSPTINDACLVQGYLEAIQRVAQKSSTLDVNVISASVWQVNFF
jgi:hypothetical protein